MSNLIIRNVDEEIVAALKRRAAIHGRSAESEHREILKDVLMRPGKKIFAEVLMGMPSVGKDEDF